MNIETQLIKNRSILLSGGTYGERDEIARSVRKLFVRELRGDVFVLAEAIKDTKKYLKSARHLFPIVSPAKNVPRSKMTYDQINEYHLEWVSRFKNVLVVMPEVQKFYQNLPEEFFELLGGYLSAQHLVSGRDRFRFLMTSDEIIPSDFNRIPVLANDGWKPSARDLEFINL